jgi:hypothetical protein
MACGKVVDDDLGAHSLVGAGAGGASPAGSSSALASAGSGATAATTGGSNGGSGGSGGSTAAIGGGAGAGGARLFFGEGFEQFTIEAWSGMDLQPCGNRERYHYQVTRTPAHLWWEGCDYSQRPEVPTMGDRPLSDSEMESVTKAFAKIGPSSAHGCVNDASNVTVDLTTRSGVERYADYVYSDCSADFGDRIFVYNLRGLQGAVRSLSGK